MKTIQSEEEYDKACTLLYEKYIESDDPVDPDSEEGKQLEALADAVEEYQKIHHPVPEPSKEDVERFQREQGMNIIPKQ